MIQAALDLNPTPPPDELEDLGGRGRRFYAWPNPRISAVVELRAKDKAAAVRQAAKAFGAEPYLVLPNLEDLE
jgi:hypothetical protein